jgi:RNA polymerase sigma factor for flagellar operon FliA
VENVALEGLATEERERLILEHLPQVKLIARKVHQHIQGRVDLDDLISTGVVGLIAAIDRFDPQRGLKLKTYAEHKIRGAILDSLRSLDSVTRDDRRRVKEIGKASLRVEQRVQRTATREEVATELGINEVECASSLQAAAAGTPLSIDAKIDRGGSDLTFAEVMADVSGRSPEQTFATEELHRVVSGAISELSVPAERVLTLHYAHGFTMRKIAPLLNMSEWQVQETRRNAIQELRQQLSMCGVISVEQPQPVLRC